MFCVPNGETDFPTATDIGRGISMHVRANASDSWAPGNFGFLDIDYPNIDPNDQNHMTGLNSDFLGCAGDCWWPAQMPDGLTNHPEFDGGCPNIARDWRNLKFD